MTFSRVIAQNPRAMTVPGWRGGPAPYSCALLCVILLGRHSRGPVMEANNDNGTCDV